MAGILVLLVDPFLKERLLSEASRGVFHYILGFDQQPKIQERLKQIILDTKLYRKNFRVRITFMPDGDSMRLEMDVSFEVVNPTNEVQTYRHLLQGEQQEKMAIQLMTLISQTGSYSETPQLKRKGDDPEVLEAEATGAQIKPASSGFAYTFATKYSMVYPREFSSDFISATPRLIVLSK